MNPLFAMGINFDEEIQDLLLLGSVLDSWKYLELHCQILLQMV